MATLYRYKATDSSGQQRRGTLSARSRRELYQRLQSQELYLLNASRVTKLPSWLRLRQAVPSRALIQLFVQLTLLERTSMHLLDSLRQTQKAVGSSRLRDVLDTIIHDIKDGSGLTDSFARFPEIFNPILLARLRAGEKSGDLTTTFSQISEYLKWREEVRKKVKKALMYPVVLIGCVIILVGLMMTFFVPQLTEFLTTLNIELSWITKSLIGSSSVAQVIGPYVLGLLIGGALIIRVGYSVSPVLAGVIDRWLYKLPFIGTTRLRLDQWNFSRLLLMTIKYNRRTQDSLQLAAEVMDNRAYKARLYNARRGLLEGQSLFDSFYKNGLLDEMAMRLLKAGEISGDLPSAFGEIVEYYSLMVDATLEKVTTVVRPAALLLAAGVLIWIIVGTMLPLYSSFSNSAL